MGTPPADSEMPLLSDMIHATDHLSTTALMRWAKRSTDGFENVHLPGFDAVGNS